MSYDENADMYRTEETGQEGGDRLGGRRQAKREETAKEGGDRPRGRR
jgi:hypothetical protein